MNSIQALNVLDRSENAMLRQHSATKSRILSQRSWDRDEYEDNAFELPQKRRLHRYGQFDWKHFFASIAILLIVFQCHISIVYCTDSASLGIDLNNGRKSSDKDAITNGVSAAGIPGSNAGLYNLDKIGSLEMSIAAVFNKVAYGTTTKRSIPDNVFSLTTMQTPQLTTYRYVLDNIVIRRNPLF